MEYSVRCASVLDTCRFPAAVTAAQHAFPSPLTLTTIFTTGASVSLARYLQDLVVLLLDYALPLATVRLLVKMNATTSMAFARKTKVIHRDRSYIRLRVLSSFSTIFAVSLARRLGLINALVLTYEKEGRRLCEFKFSAFLERCTRA